MMERQREGIAKAQREGKYKGRAPTVKRRADEIIRLKDWRDTHGDRREARNWPGERL
jgi:DNA invertase Pin-like site-specific DNA recombinase